MKYELTFNLARRSSYKIAKFPNKKLKDAYTEAEARDLKCQDLRQQFNRAYSAQARCEIAKNLDLVRYSFFKCWKREHMPDFRPQIPDLMDPSDVI